MKNWYKVANSQMNIFNNLDYVKSLFRQMDGQELEESHGWENWTHYLSLREELVEMPDILEEMQEGIVASIYGRGGWNRYHIYGNGDIVFSRMHSTDESLVEAESLGFVIS